MRRDVLTLVTMAAVILGAGCESEKETGTEGGPCYANSTCNAGLVCAYTYCVRLPDAYVKAADAGVDVKTPDALPADLSPDTAPPDTSAADLPQVKPGSWVTVKKGMFKMGSPTTEPCREPAGTGKETLHEVYLTRDFEIMASEVTQGEFQSRMGYSPAFFSFCGKDCPVERATWHDGAAYCNALSKQKGYAQCYSCTGAKESLSCVAAKSYAGAKLYDCPGYRLPTEAEWEYAYRAGSKDAFYIGSILSCVGSDANADKIGWYNMNASVKTHPVGKKAPNSLGLYDMAGNVYEWCHDWYGYDLGSATKKDPVGPASGNTRVIRGGGLGSYARSLRAAYRWDHAPANRFPNIGFRCVRTKAP